MTKPSALKPSQTTAATPRLLHYLLPALLTFCLLFALAFYWQHRPAYQATVSAQTPTKTLWQIKGNANYIDFISLEPIGTAQQESIAWLQSEYQTPIKLGIIPNTGEHQSRRIELPKSLKAKVGDLVIIVLQQRGVTADKPTVKAVMAIQKSTPPMTRQHYLVPLTKN